MHASSDSTYAARIEHVQPGRLIRPEPCRDQVLGQLAGAVHQLPVAQPVAAADKGAAVRHCVCDRADQVGQVNVHTAHAGPPHGRRFSVKLRVGRQPSAWYQHRSREMKPGRLWSPLHLPRRVVVDQVITASCEATDGAPGVVGGAKGLDLAPGCRELRPAGKADGHKHASGRRDELGCTDLARVRSGPACGGRAWRGRARC